MDENVRTVCMSVRDSLRAGICERLVENALSEEEAAERLGLSVRQVRRLKKRVKDEGPTGVIHRSRGRASPRRTPEGVQADVVGLYRETYAGWNMVHLGEYLALRHGIRLSRETLRKMLLDEESRPRRRRRKQHRQWRERRAREGELVQMDTSIHPWLGEDGEKVVLISAVDDATGRILWAEFFEHNGVLENLALVRNIVAKYGLPQSLYLDRHTIRWDKPRPRQRIRSWRPPREAPFGISRPSGASRRPPTRVPQIGHFHFAPDRTFLLCIDTTGIRMITSSVLGDEPKTCGAGGNVCPAPLFQGSSRPR